MECGSKVESSGGRMPKFCMDCGESLDGESKSTNSEAKNITASSSVKPDDIFQIEGSGQDPESSVFTFEKVLGSKEHKTSLNRPKGSKDIKDLKSRLRNRDSIDANQ
jgi:hypothetical protein